MTVAAFSSSLGLEKGTVSNDRALPSTVFFFPHRFHFSSINKPSLPFAETFCQDSGPKEHSLCRTLDPFLGFPPFLHHHLPSSIFTPILQPPQALAYSSFAFLPHRDLNHRKNYLGRGVLDAKRSTPKSIHSKENLSAMGSAVSRFLAP